jgi:hypothetical protein
MGSKIKVSKLQHAYWGHVPEAEGQPGLALEWPEDCQAAMNAAVRRVERWFGERHKSNLWVALFIGRGEQESEFQRLAYETAFLWRIQQRLALNVDGMLDA